MNAPNGSEGTRDALPPASPVPERQATAGVDRKSGRPAISCTGLFAIIFSRLALADWKNALSGRIRYNYAALGIRAVDGKLENMVVCHCGRMWGISLADAISQISEKHPDHIIRSIFKEPIGIKLFLAYPCRLARWIFSYRKLSSIELKAVSSVLRIQTRKAVLREMQNGRTTLYIDIPFYAAPNRSMPLHTADSALGLTKTVTMDDHINLANVRRQVSLAGGNGRSQKLGVKALGLLCSSQALCLNAESR